MGNRWGARKPINAGENRNFCSLDLPYIVEYDRPKLYIGAHSAIMRPKIGTRREELSWLRDPTFTCLTPTKAMLIRIECVA